MQATRASFDDRPASRVAQETSGSWGALSFGYLFFVQAKKSNSLKSEKKHYKKPQPRGHPCPTYNNHSKNTLLPQSLHAGTLANAGMTKTAYKDK
ncbi:MAG: hypothetical protein E6Q52_06710 [Methylophilus sp.]|nr:MAG: hypothetical protein E6Q52_06710 [Methylophilus sp.]